MSIYKQHFIIWYRYNIWANFLNYCQFDGNITNLGPPDNVSSLSQVQELLRLAKLTKMRTYQIRFDLNQILKLLSKWHLSMITSAQTPFIQFRKLGLMLILHLSVSCKWTPGMESETIFRLSGFCTKIKRSF